MIEYDELYKIAENKLSAKRFKHTLNVIDRAVEYAKVYGIDEDEVKLCAVAHDIAKELSDEENNKYRDTLDDIEKINNNLVHSKIGAIICKQYGFNDDMINAIKYHTTGRENMSILEKIIYLADATEEGRKVGSTYTELVKKDIDKGMIEILSWTIKKLLDENKVIHIDTIKCYNYYILNNLDREN